LDLTETLRFGSSSTSSSTVSHSLEVRPLSLRMFLQLCAVRSPFLVGGAIRPEHVAQVLWRLSPQYDARNNLPLPLPLNLKRADEEVEEEEELSPRQRFIASIAALPFRPAVRAISRFLDRMLIDRPPSRGGGDGSKADTSFAAALIHTLASAYGWSDDQILDTPMPRLFQYIRKIQREAAAEHGQALPTFNPLRDRLTKRLTEKFMAARKSSSSSPSSSV
jgi:hypothetical protein